MVNHRGGHVLFGVDAGGRVLGQQVSDRTLEEIAQEISAIDPPVLPSIERVPVGDGREVVVVTVPVGRSQPYTHRGQAYRRVGNINRAMSRDEYNRVLLERLHADTRWENQPAEGWTVADLDHEEIRRTLEEGIRLGRIGDPGTREPDAILRGLGLTEKGALLRAAVVLFGTGERLLSQYSQCLLRVARFKGTDKTEFLDNRQFRGHAFALFLRAQQFLLDHVPVAGRIVPERFERIDEPLYPPLAVREALANAICHRDYSIGGGSIGIAMYDDRLEVTSSGRLHFGLTPQILFEPHESLPWNPLIANVFYRRGIIETWGRGTLRMAEIAEEAGLPRPEIEETQGAVVVRFRPGRRTESPSAGAELTERQQRVLAFLAESGGVAAVREIAAALDVAGAPWRIREDLAALKRLGRVRSTGRGRGARWELRTP